MIVASHIVGGLGNQLFCYAAGRALAWRRGARFELRDEFFHGQVPFGRVYALDHFTGPRGVPTSPSGWVFRAVLALARRVPSAAGTVLIERSPARFEPRVRGCLRRGTVHLVGCWQSERYFDDVREELLRDLKPGAPVSDASLGVAREIERESDPVAVHLRAYRDIPDPRARRPLPAGYVQRACREIRARYPRARLFLFADEPGSFREVARTLGPHRWVDHNASRGNEGALEDLYLMSRCRHFVVANSSLSWWGAWLSQQSRGLVQGSDPGDRLIFAPGADVFNADFVPPWWSVLPVP